MAVGEVTDVNPWNGWEITHGPHESLVGPIQTPIGCAHVQSVYKWMKVIIDGDTILQATVPGRYRHVMLGETNCRVMLPPVPADDHEKRWLAFPKIRRDRVKSARVGGQSLVPELTADVDGSDIGSYFRLPPTTEAQPFELVTS
jgi:hypothetical protein